MTQIDVTLFVGHDCMAFSNKIKPQAIKSLLKPLNIRAIHPIIPSLRS